jgi:hypothetical protein
MVRPLPESSVRSLPAAGNARGQAMKLLIGLSFAAVSIAATAATTRAPTDEQRSRCANEDFSLHISDAEAIAACTQIIDLKPTDVLDYALAYSNRAVAEMASGEEAKANADLRAAHRIDPKDFHANPK